MLEIGVHDDHGIAVERIDPCGQCDLLAKVPRQFEQADAAVLRGQRLDLGNGVIAAPVVGE